MRRLLSILTVGAIVMVAVIALGSGGARVVAQESTPSGEELPQGIAGALVALGPASVLPSSPADIAVVRLTFQPGATLPASASDPSAAFVVVESGQLTLQANVPISVSRASGGTPTPLGLALETVPANTATTLHAGDAFYGPPNVAGTLRNDGSVPLVILLINISPSGSATPGA